MQENNDDGEKFDPSKAQLFDALGHPTRIEILHALNEQPLTFSELKKKVGIESSGHLSFHIGKLGDLVRVSEQGTYELTDDGKEAFHLFEVVSMARSPASVANSIEKSRKRTLPNIRSKRSIVIVSTTIIIVVLLIVGVAISSGNFVFYNNQQTLSGDYQKQITASPWQTVNFNETSGDNLLSDFNFNLAGLPVAANATVQTDSLGISIWHADGTFLDSLSLQFVPANPSNCCFVLEQVADLGVGGSPPVASQLFSQNAVTTYYIQSFGSIGVATVNLGLLLSLSRLVNLANLPTGNNSLVLNIQFTMHKTNTVIVGQVYTATVSIPLNIMPNGLIALGKSSEILGI